MGFVAYMAYGLQFYMESYVRPSLLWALLSPILSVAHIKHNLCGFLGTLVYISSNHHIMYIHVRVDTHNYTQQTTLNTVDSKKWKRGCRMMTAGSPSLFGLGLKNGHVPTVWLHCKNP